jgi:urease accessory protein
LAIGRRALRMDDASFIAALQLADSFFPSGMVTLSHGLEAFISVREQSPQDILPLLEDYLHNKIAPCDLVAYAHAYLAAQQSDHERLVCVDQFLTASLLPHELRQGSVRSGRALLDTLAPLIEHALFQQFAQAVKNGRADGNAAVNFGLVSALWDIPLRVGSLMQLYTFAVSFLGAAMRLGCLGHREAQRILLVLRPQLPALVDEACQRDLNEIGSFVPLADIRAMQHAYLPVRLFSS